MDGMVDPATLDLEAMACNEALSAAADLDQVATDCLDVVKNMTEKNPCKYGAVMVERGAQPIQKGKRGKIERPHLLSPRVERGVHHKNDFVALESDAR